MPKQTTKSPNSQPTVLGSEDSFRLLVESVKDYAIVMLDPTGHVVKGLGMGLPGLKRLMDELTIESTVGNATTAIMRKWLK
jgi:hypothetical protein